MISDGRSHDPAATDHDSGLTGQRCDLGFWSCAEKPGRAPRAMADRSGSTAPGVKEEPGQQGWGQSSKAPRTATHGTYTCNKTTHTVTGVCATSQGLTTQNISYFHPLYYSMYLQPCL